MSTKYDDDINRGLAARSAERRARIQARLNADDAAAAIFLSPEDIYVLSGFHTPGHYAAAALIVPVCGEPCIVSREFERGNIEVAWIDDSVGYFDHESFEDKTLGACRERGIRGKVRVQDDAWYVSPERFERMRSMASDRGIEWSPASRLLDDLRLVKNDAELACSREAGRITSLAMHAAIDAMGEGVSDQSVAGTIYRVMIEAGSEYPSLPPFVAFGEGLPHATWHGAVAGKGTCAFIEIGAVYRRYGAAMQRTVHVGEPSDMIREAAAASEEGLAAAAAMMATGAVPDEVCRACKAPLDALGIGEYSKNRAGYSLGVSFPPDWGEGDLLSLKYDEHRPLEAGMIFHVIPSVVMPGLGEIGTSASVLVTDSGGELITDPIPAMTVV